MLCISAARTQSNTQTSCFHVVFLLDKLVMMHQLKLENNNFALMMSNSDFLLTVETFTRLLETFNPTLIQPFVVLWHLHCVFPPVQDFVEGESFRSQSPHWKPVSIYLISHSSCFFNSTKYSGIYLRLGLNAECKQKRAECLLACFHTESRGEWCLGPRPKPR